MTKKEIIRSIFHRLSANGGYEINVPEFEFELRNGRWGFRAYCITLLDGYIVCRPWSGADADSCWDARLERLTRSELMYLLEKCPEL